MRATLLALAIFVAFAAPVSAECPCIPLTHLWIVKTCSDWNCAATEMMLGGGDPQVIAMPVAMDDSRWLIVHRFVAGGAIDVSDDPFELRQFDGMDGAVTHFSALDHDRHKLMLTAPDGQILVISLKQAEPKRRAAAH